MPPPNKKKLSATDEALIADVKDELDKPDLPDDEQDTDADKTVDKNEPEIENPQVEPDAVANTSPDDETVDDKSDVAEVRPVFDPCRVCFPKGWPAAEDGAFVNCAHGHAVTFGGDPVYIDRERAVELGFIEE